MKLILKYLNKHYKVIVDAVAVLVMLGILNYLKLLDIGSLFLPATWQIQCQSLIQALPLSVIFGALGWYCFASAKDHELAADIANAKNVKDNNLPVKPSQIAEWFNKRRALIAQICWVIAFGNLLRVIDHNQQSTLFATALIGITVIVQDRAKKSWACWIAKYSNDPLQRITPGEYLLFLNAGKLICKVNRVGDTSLFAWRVFKDDTLGGDMTLPISMISDGLFERGTLEQLRRTIKESA